MERELLARLTAATQAIGLPDAVDLRDQLATNPGGRQWRTRSIYDLKGKGDENAEFLAVMYEGLFKGSGVTTSSAGEPNDLQMLAGLLLWQQAKRIWKWQGNDLFGHFQFGKPACPGHSLQSIIEAVRFNSPKTPGFA